MNQLPPASLKPQLTPEQAKEIHIRQFAEMLYMQFVVESYKGDSPILFKEAKQLAFAAAEALVND